MSDTIPVLGTAPSAIVPDPPAGQTLDSVIEAAPTTIKDVTSAVTHPSIATVVPAVGELMSLAPAAPAIVEESRRGYKTTEFWAGIAAAVQAVATELPQTDKVALIALAAVYAVARGVAKNGVPFVPAPIAPEA